MDRRTMFDDLDRLVDAAARETREKRDQARAAKDTEDRLRTARKKLGRKPRGPNKVKEASRG